MNSTKPTPSAFKRRPESDSNSSNNKANKSTQMLSQRFQCFHVFLNRRAIRACPAHHVFLHRPLNCIDARPRSVCASRHCRNDCAQQSRQCLCMRCHKRAARLGQALSHAMLVREHASALIAIQLCRIKRIAHTLQYYSRRCQHCRFVYAVTEAASVIAPHVVERRVGAHEHRHASTLLESAHTVRVRFALYITKETRRIADGVRWQLQSCRRERRIGGVVGGERIDIEKTQPAMNRDTKLTTMKITEHKRRAGLTGEKSQERQQLQIESDGAARIRGKVGVRNRFPRSSILNDMYGRRRSGIVAKTCAQRSGDIWGIAERTHSEPLDAQSAPQLRRHWRLDAWRFDCDSRDAVAAPRCEMHLFFVAVRVRVGVDIKVCENFIASQLYPRWSQIINCRLLLVLRGCESLIVMVTMHVMRWHSSHEHHRRHRQQNKCGQHQQQEHCRPHR
jgi:hypothetical protein